MRFSSDGFVVVEGGKLTALAAAEAEQAEYAARGEQRAAGLRYGRDRQIGRAHV